MNWGDISSDESEDEDMMVMPTEHAGLNDGFVGQVRKKSFSAMSFKNTISLPSI